MPAMFLRPPTRWSGPPMAARAHGWQADPIDLALVALVRAQVVMGAVASVGPVLRGGTPEQRALAQAELAGIDEARVLLERANRPDDGFYSTYVLRRASQAPDGPGPAPAA